jgi:hypothetical protein
VGVVTALLTVTGTVTLAPVFTIVAAGIAVAYFLVLLLGARFGRLGCTICKRRALTTILVGLIGVLLTAVLLLAVGFAATSILGAVVTGLLLAFLTLVFASTACYVSCAADCVD